MEILKDQLKGKFEAEIATPDNGSQVVTAEIVEGHSWEGRTLIVHKSNRAEGYTVSDLETGLYLDYGRTKRAAIALAEDNLIRHQGDLKKVLKKAIKKLKEYGLPYPLNQIK